MAVQFGSAFEFHDINIIHWQCVLHVIRSEMETAEGCSGVGEPLAVTWQVTSLELQLNTFQTQFTSTLTLESKVELNRGCNHVRLIIVHWHRCPF
jgi:hypothetical protein